MMFFSCNLSNVISLKCVSMSNQECKVRPKIVNVKNDEPVYKYMNHWYLKKDVICIKFGTRTQTTIS